jgi:hypothetical protein
MAEKKPCPPPFDPADPAAYMRYTHNLGIERDADPIFQPNTQPTPEREFRKDPKPNK